MILKHWITKKDIEIKTSKELKEFLALCNPSMLKNYKAQLLILKPNIGVTGSGASIELFKKEMK